MNRRARRAARLDRANRISRCPDCNSKVSITRVGARTHVIVQHDDSCPWFADFARRGGYGIRLYREQGQ